jgi:phytoene dehydrogenase-like protein
VSPWDVIVLGASPNGLAAAGSLARKGKKVLVLERLKRAGGVAAGRELAPGIATEGLLQDTSHVPAELVSRLGLKMIEPPPVLGLQLDGPGLLLHRSPRAAKEEISAHSASDAVGYADWRGWLSSVLPTLRRSILAAPFEVGLEAPLLPLLRVGGGVRALGKDTMMELLRRAPLSALDLVSEFVETPLLRSMILAPGLRGTWMGPRSPTSAATLLLHEAQADLEVSGGPQAFVDALVADCEARGVVIRLGQDIRAVALEGQQVVGVECGDATERSVAVVSCFGPRHTLLDLVPARNLRGAGAREIENIRVRGTLAAVSFALAVEPRFRCRPGMTVRAAQWAESPEHQERAWDDAKHRRFPRRPTLDLRIHQAEEGWVLHALVRSASFELADGWTAERRQELGDLVQAQLVELLVIFEGTIVARDVLSPAEIGREYGLDGGHELQAELALDQLHAFRPAPRLGHYRTSVGGLWLASAGSHPGGAVDGRAGLLAATALLRA